LLRDCTIGEFDERKAARPAGLAIDRHHDVGRFRNGREVRSEIRFAGTVWKVPDEQTNCQDSLVKGANCSTSTRRLRARPCRKQPPILSQNAH
jgi:hypothetical protein